MSRDAHDSRSPPTEFPKVDYRTWRNRVVDELQGEDFDDALVSRTIGGLDVQPLYTRETSRILDPIDGTVPTDRGWLICQSYSWHHGDQIANAIHQDLANGVQGISIRFEQGNRDSLNSIFPESAPLPKVLLLEAGVDGLEVGEGVASWMSSRSIQPEDPRISIGLDPLATLAATGVLSISTDRAAMQIKRGVELSETRLPGSRAIAVSTSTYSNGGADAALQLALCLSTALEYLRWLETRGVEAGDCVDQFVFRFDIGKDLFGEICKLRALRHLWPKLTRHFGVEPKEPLWVHAETADRVLTTRDVATNLLRTATGTLAAILGGATTISCSAYDSAQGESSDRGRRLARNLQLIFREESHLDSIKDPARGSYYIESLTEKLARAAWQHFRHVEEKGGMAAALSSGAVQNVVHDHWKTRRRRFADRSDPITGISFFARPDETPPPPGARNGAVDSGAETDTRSAGPSDTIRITPVESHRDSADYEALRTDADRLTGVLGHRPAVLILPVPDRTQVRESVSFAQNLFRAGGFRVIVDEEAMGISNSDMDRFPRQDWLQSDSPIICICASPEVPRETVGSMASQAVGVGAIAVACETSEPDSPIETGVDESIYPGIDAVAVLGRLLERVSRASGERA